MKKLALSFQLSALSFFLASCNLPAPQADTVRYFTLSGPVAAAADGATVRPVQLAGHLRNRSMAVRVSPNEITYNEDVRWAEALDDAITQLLRARVGAVGAGSVITRPVAADALALGRAPQTEREGWALAFRKRRKAAKEAAKAAKG